MQRNGRQQRGLTETYPEEQGDEAIDVPREPTRNSTKKAAPIDDGDKRVVPVVRQQPLPKVSESPGAGFSNTATTVLITVVATALMAATAVFGFLYFDTRSALNARKADDADRVKAEKIAADYAVGASTFDYRDLGPWTDRVTNNVSLELKPKMEAAVRAMNQIVQPLQMVSKGTIMDSVVNSQSGPVYKVSAYVKIQWTNARGTGDDEVIAYNVTLNKDADWQITDAGAPVQPGGLAQSDPSAAPAPTSTVPAPGN